jgi:hypothetical protein
MATRSKATQNRSAASKRAAGKNVKTTAANEGNLTEGSPDAVTRPGDPDTHQANVNQPGSSEVAHAPASGTLHAEGGYPAGEYDVTKPTTAPDGSKTAAGELADTKASTAASQPKGEFGAQLAQHFTDAGADQATLMKQATQNTRLSDDERQAVLEAMPVGAILEHEAANRWRVHVIGRPRFGHGASAAEAIEAFVIGNQGSDVEASAQRFANLPASVQQEIRERDQRAQAGTGGVDPTEFARQEALKVAKADKQAKPTAASEGSDGANRESARREVVGNVPKAKGATKTAAKRSGSKK